MAAFESRNGKCRARVCKAYRRYSRTFKTKAEAEAWATALESRLDRDAPASSELRHRWATRRFFAAPGDVTLSLEQIVSRAVKYERRCGVYFLIRKGRVVYIGQSANIDARIASHARRLEFDAVSVLECSARDLAIYEGRHIAMLKPDLNKSAPLHPKLPQS